MAWITLALFAVGCAAKVVSLDGPQQSPAQIAAPFPVSVKVEPFSGTASEVGFSVSKAEALAQALRDQQIFARVSDPNTEGPSVDLILRGDVQSHWDTGGRANFYTWWPGGLIFAPNWRGTRMSFFTQATFELVDATSGERVGEYKASTAHEMIHRSSSPGPFFGALIVVPAVMKGASVTSPRWNFKARVYPVAYRELWQRVVAKIVEDRAPFYANEEKERAARCGEKLDRPPVIGESWTEFRNCQSNYYAPKSEVLTDQGATSVFVDTHYESRISVVDGTITHWEHASTGSTPDMPSPPPLPDSSSDVGN